MNLVLHPESLELFAKAGYKGAESHAKFSAHLPLRLQLTEVSEKDLKIIEKVMASIGDLRSKIALANIRMFRNVEGGEDVPVRKLQQAVPALRAYIKGSPLGKKRQYILMEQHDDDDLYLPYVCFSITYTPPVRTRWGTRPPYVQLECAYYQNGSVHTTHITLHGGDVVGKTCHVILREQGWMISTPELAEKYETDIKRFRELMPQVGLKCLAGGTAEVESDWRSRRTSMEVDGKRSPVVIDIVESDDDDQKSKPPYVDGKFWYDPGEKIQALDLDNNAIEDDDIEDGDPQIPPLETPLHPYVHVFDLQRHEHLDIHVRYLEVYKYDPEIGKSLVLPKDSKELIEALVGVAKCDYEDIIAGKSGGTIIMCAGEPGTGKTLTAECYSEVMGKPLYSIQSSQLGTSAEELEAELKKVLSRAMRWKAILLIDEADVFIHERGESIEHNAVVGIFLRVLEYYSGVLFLTTNRATIIDDAIASRCTAHVHYKKPESNSRLEIWRILAEKAKIKTKLGTLESANKEFQDISGRDIKNLLKLSNYMARHRKKTIDIEMLRFAKRFSMESQEAK